MAKMGLEAIYKRPRTSQPHPQHPVYPYPLRKMQIDRPNQVWCADITFVPVRNGFLYLVGDPVDFVEDRVCAADTEPMGQEGRGGSWRPNRHHDRDVRKDEGTGTREP